MLALLLALTDPQTANQDSLRGQDEIDWSYYYRETEPETHVLDGDRWTFTLSRKLEECFAYVKKNGETVVTFEGWGGQVCFRRCWLPTPWPVFLVGGHSANGHGQRIAYYAVQGGKARLLVTVEGECGGPVFRDFDGDGVMEWVFDDDEWYTYYGSGPTRYFVYRVDGSGGLELWKTLPNRARAALPNPGFDWFPD